MQNKLILLFLLLASSCTAPQPIVSTVLQPVAPMNIPDIDPLTLNPVQWQVLSLPQLKQLVAQMEKSPPNQQVMLALDTRNYKNLSLNLIDIQRYISEQKAILTMLKNIITERSQAAAPHD